MSNLKRNPRDSRKYTLEVMAKKTSENYTDYEIRKRQLLSEQKQKKRVERAKCSYEKRTPVKR